jgi:hypothetical protein
MEYMKCDFSVTTQEEEDVRLDGQVVPKKDIFHYLWSILQKDRDIDEDVSHRIKVDCLKWCQASGVLCDTRMSLKLKEKFYRTEIQQVMLYVAECWPTERWHVQQLSIAEMRMLQGFMTHKKRLGSERWHTRETRGGTSWGEARATSFEIVWTYPTEAHRDINS